MIPITVLLRSHPLREQTERLDLQVSKWDAATVVLSITHVTDDDVVIGRPQIHRLVPSTFIFYPPNRSGTALIVHVDRNDESSFVFDDWEETGWSTVYDVENPEESTHNSALAWIATAAHYDNDSDMWDTMSIYLCDVQHARPNVYFPHKIMSLPAARDSALAIEHEIVDACVYLVVWKLIELYTDARSIVFHDIKARDVVLCWYPYFRPMLAPTVCGNAAALGDVSDYMSNFAFFDSVDGFIKNCHECILLPNVGRMRLRIDQDSVRKEMKHAPYRFAAFVAQGLPSVKSLTALLCRRGLHT